MATINRRDFIRTGGVAGVGLLLIPSCISKVSKENTYRFFTEEEADCVINICEQLIPSGPNFGGAKEAGVVHYIDGQLVDTFKEHASTYRNNLKKLQDYCDIKFGKSFQRLSTDKQESVLISMENNTVDRTLWDQPSNFFRLVQRHSMQGFYGSPLHGGNKDHMSFDMLRIDGMLKMRLESPYQAV